MVLEEEFTLMASVVQMNSLMSGNSKYGQLGIRIFFVATYRKLQRKLF